MLLKKWFEVRIGENEWREEYEEEEIPDEWFNGKQLNLFSDGY